MSASFTKEEQVNTKKQYNTRFQRTCDENIFSAKHVGRENALHLTKFVDSNFDLAETYKRLIHDGHTRNILQSFINLRGDNSRLGQIHGFSLHLSDISPGRKL